MTDQLNQQTPVQVVQQKLTKSTTAQFEPWTSFGSYDTKFFKEDFLNDNSVGVKLTAKSSKQSSLTIKQNYHIDQKKHNFTQEIKLQVPLQNNNLLVLRINQKNWKVGYDLAKKVWFRKNVYVYSSLNFSRKYEDISMKLGATFVPALNWKTDFRIKCCEVQGITYYNRTMFEKDNLKAAVVLAYGQKHLKNDFLASYDYNQNLKIWIKGIKNFDNKYENKSSQHDLLSNIGLWFNQLTLSTLYKHNNWVRYGTQLTFKPDSRDLTASLVYQKGPTPNDVLKIKLSSSINKLQSGLNLSYVLKRRVTADTSVAIGGNTSIDNWSTSKSSFGLQINANI